MGGVFEQSEYYVRLYAESSPMAYLLIFTVYSNIFIYIYCTKFFNMDTQCKHVKERFVPFVSIITHKVLADVRKRAPNRLLRYLPDGPVTCQDVF